jgi:hypothetical protein
MPLLGPDPGRGHQQDERGRQQGQGRAHGRAVGWPESTSAGESGPVAGKRSEPAQARACRCTCRVQHFFQRGLGGHQYPPCLAALETTENASSFQLVHNAACAVVAQFQLALDQGWCCLVGSCTTKRAASSNMLSRSLLSMSRPPSPSSGGHLGQDQGIRIAALVADEVGDLASTSACPRRRIAGGSGRCPCSAACRLGRSTGPHRQHPIWCGCLS